MKNRQRLFPLLAFLLLLILACNLPGDIAAPTPTQSPVLEDPTAVPEEPQSTEAPIIIEHQVFPANAPNSAQYYDADSLNTAPEKRAPYGDSYDINRLERPFLQDMTYVADLDIRVFKLSRDADWFYISMELIGADPNNPLGINYGVEFDLNRDGFGDYVIVASPPYTNEWTAANVRVLADENRNTSGLSSARSDAPYLADGYEKLIFDGSLATNEDPDLAWVKMSIDRVATIQFAVKRSFVGNVFMYGAFADAGLKDVSQLDYVDRFTETEAGSPIRDKKDYYPLKALHSFDNTCREAHGFDAQGYEPMLCPREIPPTEQPQVGCTNPGQYNDQSSCQAALCSWEPNPGVFIAVVYYCTFP
jgi:hypothetical protein